MQPCREDGRTSLEVPEGTCTTANWVSSFDSAGWSHCPDNTYMQGLYKSSCELIYCIEYARCCRINGGGSRRSCGQKQSWWGSLDGYGWSLTDGHTFMTGLWRNWCHWLYCIEMPMQCTIKAYD